MQTEGLAAYGVIFAVLVACGLGIPLPEDVSLVTGGFLVYLGAAQLEVMMAVGFVGILAGDTLIFLAGRRIGTQVGRSGHGFFGRVVTPEKRRKVEELFRRHGEKIVMIARFLPGARAVTYFTAGSARMKYRHFIFFDAIAALASAPLFVYLGYRFGDELEALIRSVRRGESAVIVVLTLVAAFFAYRKIRASLRRKREELEGPALPGGEDSDPKNSSLSSGEKQAGSRTPRLGLLLVALCTAAAVGGAVWYLFARQAI